MVEEAAVVAVWVVARGVEARVVEAKGAARVVEARAGAKEEVVMVKAARAAVVREAVMRVAEVMEAVKGVVTEMGETRAARVVAVEAYGGEASEGGGSEGGVCGGDGGCGVCDCVVEELSATAPNCSASPPLRTGRSSVGRLCQPRGGCRAHSGALCRTSRCPGPHAPRAWRDWLPIARRRHRRQRPHTPPQPALMVPKARGQLKLTHPSHEQSVASSLAQLVGTQEVASGAPMEGEMAGEVAMREGSVALLPAKGVG